jgi:hypothetical protein
MRGASGWDFQVNGYVSPTRIIGKSVTDLEVFPTRKTVLSDKPPAFGGLRTARFAVV